VRIGLTGGIGSGKSTVATLLVRSGAHLVDSDAISRRLTAAGGAAMPALAAVFGPDIVAADGGLDRARMRELAFADPDARRRLEAVLHPMIGSETERAAAAAGGRPVVFDVPLLAESQHWRTRVDRVLVVDCSETTQVERVTQRSGWSADTVRAVIAQQAQRPLRRAIADAVLFNDGLSMDELGQAVVDLYGHWTGRSAGL
jgi:dephospho-CoA kinase